MKKHKNNLIKIIIAILALFIILTKPSFALLNVDDDQSKVESQLGSELKLGTGDDAEESENASETNTNDGLVEIMNKAKIAIIIFIKLFLYFFIIPPLLFFH